MVAFALSNSRRDSPEVGKVLGAIHIADEIAYFSLDVCVLNFLLQITLSTFALNLFEV